MGLTIWNASHAPEPRQQQAFESLIADKLLPSAKIAEFVSEDVSEFRCCGDWAKGNLSGEIGRLQEIRKEWKGKNASRLAKHISPPDNSGKMAMLFITVGEWSCGPAEEVFMR